MRTPRQSQTARENGKKSRGPKTPEGKARAARVVTRHGLLARNLLLDRESADRFHQIVIGLHEEFLPQTPAETAAVESMAWSRWRQMRLWTLEQAALNAEIRRLKLSAPAPSPDSSLVCDEACSLAAEAFASLAGRSNTLNLFNRYENAYDRQFSRALRRLLALREARQSAPENKNGERSRQILEKNTPFPESEPGPNPV